ncbi:MAG: PilC/PilY family type IV pilus protein [Gallionella sp.]|nr:PilC/PilY family type IV pilus protein [Gallionella sp.]
MKIYPKSHAIHWSFAAIFLFTEISAYATAFDSTPLASSGNSSVKPNVLFILDDSGSMGWEYLPDSVKNNDDRNCYRNHYYNGVYYNPSVTYTPPVRSEGSSYPNSTFTAALVDGFGGTTTKNLSSEFRTGDDRSNSAAYYYVYAGSSPSSPVAGTCYSDSDYTKVAVGSTSGPGGADERENFANWYSYYRDRLNTMKTSAGLAFKDIGNNYRVGFSTISYTGSDSSNARFLAINDFDATQKATWYDKLYGTTTASATPLRAALSKAGRLYAGKLSVDPVQYSCQQNFTILSTDGYWNTNNETSSYGPHQIDNVTDVGQQDGGATPRPMNDSTTQLQSSTMYLKKSTNKGDSWNSTSSCQWDTSGSSQTWCRYTKSSSSSTEWTNSNASWTDVSACTPDYSTNTNHGTTWSGNGTQCRSSSGGALSTLADVAMYYYQTDLRASAFNNCTGALGVDVCENNVPGAGGDINMQQHMTTFTLGLGVDGTLAYASDYLSGGSADYEAIKQGTKGWPDPINNSGAERIDDLWHAAVNGRGVYYSARDPDSLVSGLSKALAGVSARTGSAAAAATSSLEPVAGDNYIFVALYTTVDWYGDLQAKTIDPDTGAVTSTPLWQAQELLDNKLWSTRAIYTYDAASSNKLTDFGASHVGSDTNLANFIKGDRTNEGILYRVRTHVLGDIVSSQPVYVKQPPFPYADTNYATFKDNNVNRTAMVYVGANDGMLHAFDASTGEESWAYIPPMMLGKLTALADVNYSINHQFFVDGSPVLGDICPNAPSNSCNTNQWKSILVGGLNGGGKGYYALDVTDPANPKALWNFTNSDDADLQYTFGNPVITKRKDGTWVVVFASGYSGSSTDNSAAALYVLNANTGQLLEKISTGAQGELAKINAWINDPEDNTAERFYGGDTQGNLWRFSLATSNPAAAGSAVNLATLGPTQPITTKPDLTIVPYGASQLPVVAFGTGRFLSTTDRSVVDIQSVYALKDDLSSTGLGAVRTNGVLVQQTLSDIVGSGGQLPRTATNYPVDWTNKYGWYVDLDADMASPGERVFIDVQFQLGALTVASNEPSDNACTIGGYSWLYNFDFRTGSYLSTAVSSAVGHRLSTNAMVAGLSTIRLQSGKILTIVTDTGGTVSTVETPTATGASGTVKRTSWRELTQ